MTIEAVQAALAQGVPIEFYSSGKGFVAWIDEGWHQARIEAVDEQFPRVILRLQGTSEMAGDIGVEVRGASDIEQLLRIPDTVCKEISS